MVLTVNGRVGLVLDGRTLGSAGDLDDVRGVAAAGPLGVVGVDRPALEGGDGVLDEAGLVERVGVDGHLHVVACRRRPGSSRWRPAWCPSPRAASGRRRRRGSAPPAARAGCRCPCRGSPSSPAVPRPPGACASRFQRPGVQVVAQVPVAEPVPPPIIVVMPEAMATSTCCGQMKWMWRVDAAGGADHPLAGDDLGARADDQARIDAGLDQRVARLADGDDPAVADADVALDDAPAVEDDGVGDDQVEVRRARRLQSAAWPMPSRIDLAAAEDDLLAEDGEVLLDLDEQFGVGQADAVARRSGRSGRRRPGGIIFTLMRSPPFSRVAEPRPTPSLRVAA